MSKVTKLKPRDGSTARTDYSRTIQGTSLESAIEEQRAVAWEVEAVLRLAAESLWEVSSRLDGVGYTQALQAAADRLHTLGDALEAGPLEDRATAIAQREAEAASGGAA